MDGNPEIISLASQLALAVEAALNPEIPQDKRHEAYNACEEFKEKSPFCIQCSVYLALNGANLVRHFGLQLMEYCVKYKWYDIDQPSKISFKDVTMSLLHSCKDDIRQQAHLRDALSRVIVEMMKREWPQQWPNLLPELFEIASKGHLQAEIVLLTLLRFIEDVVVLQTLEYAQRRKDLYQHFVLQLEEVFTFLLNLMALHYKMAGNVESVRIINLSLKLLTEIVEFAFINRLVAEEKRLLPVLCNLLAEENYQFETAECLNRIAVKKGKHEDRHIICKLLLNSNLISSISRLNLLLCNGATNEGNYLFIKKVSELLSSMCGLLCAVVKSDAEPLHEYISGENFILFLEILVSLCNHPSFVVAFNVNICWNQLFKHPVLNKNANVHTCVTKWVSSVAPKLMKVPFTPNQQTMSLFQECYKYIIYDFDSEDSFATFFYRFRVELLDAFRHLTAIAPAITFGAIEQWLATRVQKSSTVSGSSQVDELEWEAISVLMETIIANLPKNHELPLERSLRLLELCLDHKPSDPSIISLMLSCVSALSFFLSTAPQEVRNVYVPRLLDLIFTCLVYEAPNESNFARSKTVRELRKHAGCWFVKCSARYPFLFLPFYDHIHKLYVDLGPSKLNKMEVVLLLESMLLISNAFNDYQRQSQFIDEIFAETRAYWAKVGGELLGADCSKFAAHVGLLQATSAASVHQAQRETFLKNRADLMYCVNLTAAILKRCACSDAKEVAMMGAGGRRNPCAQHVLPALPYVFALIKTVHSLWAAEAKAKLPVEYAKVHELSDVDLKILIGSHMQRKAKQALPNVAPTNDLARLQTFFSTLYEGCFTILMKACQNLGASLYELPNFAPSFVASVFHNLDCIPDFRLRMMVKNFLRPFIYCCPPDKYDSILVPICAYFSAYMLQRLSNKWKYLKECRDSGKLNEDSGEDSKELIEDFLNTQLSREYMDVVKSMLLKLNASDLKLTNGEWLNTRRIEGLRVECFIRQKLDVCIGIHQKKKKRFTGRK